MAKCLTCNNEASGMLGGDRDNIIGLSETIAQLNNFCTYCTDKIISMGERYYYDKDDGHIETDGYIKVCLVTEGAIDSFIVKKLANVADRVKKDLPLTQCVAMGSWNYPDSQCHRYSYTEINGLPLCGIHANLVKKYGHVHNIVDTEYSDRNLLAKYAQMFIKDQLLRERITK